MSHCLTFSLLQQVRRPFDYLLDNYSGASVAYSLRKLNSSYTGYCIKIKRDSDGAEQDIGFLNNVIDISTINSFCTGTIGRVKIWYDQSGNGKNLSSIGAMYNYIYDNGLAYLNNKPAIKTQAQNYEIESSACSNYLGANYTNATIFLGLHGARLLYCLSGDAGFDIYSSYASTIYYRTGDQSGRQITNACPTGYTTTQGLKLFYSTGSNAYIRWNGSEVKSGGVSGTPNISFNSKLTLLSSTNYYAQEIIIYNSDKSSDISGIETNINNFYSIY